MNARDHARKTMIKRKHSLEDATRVASEPVKVTVKETKADTVKKTDGIETSETVTVKKGKKRVANVSIG